MAVAKKIPKVKYHWADLLPIGFGIAFSKEMLDKETRKFGFQDSFWTGNPGAVHQFETTTISKLE